MTISTTEDSDTCTKNIKLTKAKKIPKCQNEIWLKYFLCKHNICITASYVRSKHLLVKFLFQICS